MGVEIVVGQILLIVAMAICGLILNRILKIDNSLGCLLVGVAAGWLVPQWGIDTGIRANNLQDLVFYLLLPVLIFEATWHIAPGDLKRWLKPILILASVGVVLSTLFGAVFIYYGINHPSGFPWIAALICGVILATTDPTITTAKLEQQQASKDLITVMKGESLFSDASTIVLFSLLIAIATHPDGSSNISITTFFISTFMGGLVLGGIMGLVAAILTLLLASHSTTRIVLLFVAVGSFYLAKNIFEVSGIMAVMGTAIVARICLNEKEHSFLLGADGNWHWLALLFSSVLFVLMGLVITPDMFSHQWLAILIGIAAAILSRSATIFLCTLMTRPLSRNIEKHWQPVLIWGDIRGVVAIALVLTLPTSLSYWWTIQSIVFGVVLFNLLVQAPSSRWLIRRLNADK
ncbi:cation:proton antiporter [Dasania sp. GY-MA-18]|uniref:Cation:proton antiporter n=1 Tax=Dasania phycosphaerae TaxID=2950436 RepID=A0A9J6RP08_9GAMM|nr:MULTISPECIES: cation:proton antiporter [Dasania]MCR8923624.1 cation:proton antiporter [Dasania sp. GY-MA-18]MCZ0866058.1 cation:proton antiporter [Dasania phycosphaerae]MCZ0869782.1 cation:proton antiporter [Dasania phycosphaerae]